MSIINKLASHGVLVFPTSDVARITAFEHNHAAPGNAQLRLVGDHGVYLIPAADTGVSPADAGVVVYAVGCDPRVEDFDLWWSVKHRTFGGDDGVEFIPLEMFARWAGQKPGLACSFIAVEFTSESIKIGPLSVAASLAVKREYSGVPSEEHAT